FSRDWSSDVCSSDLWPRTRRATSRTSFVNEYSVLPRLEAWAARDCAVFDSTYTSCLVIRRCLRFALGFDILREDISPVQAVRFGPNTAVVRFHSMFNRASAGRRGRPRAPRPAG